MKTLKRGGAMLVTLASDMTLDASFMIRMEPDALTTNRRRLAGAAGKRPVGQPPTDLIYCTLDQRASGCCFVLMDCPTAEGKPHSLGPLRD
jgi:hypothetical protein